MVKVQASLCPWWKGVAQKLTPFPQEEVTSCWPCPKCLTLGRGAEVCPCVATREVNSTPDSMPGDGRGDVLTAHDLEALLSPSTLDPKS